MIDVIYTDTETFSDVDIKKAGTVKYTDSAELMLAGFKQGDRYEVYDAFEPDTVMPKWVKDHVKAGGKLVAHNALFDFGILNKKLPELRIEQMIDSQAIVAAHGLPLSLEKSGEAMGLSPDKQKLKDGKRLVRKFCMPRKPTKSNPATRIYPKDSEVDWEIFRNEYLRLDIESMEEIVNKLGFLSDEEQQVWVDTQVINIGGIPVDTDTTKLIIHKLDKLVDDESSEYIRTTGHFPTQRNVALQWCNDNGCKMDNLQAATVQSVLDSNFTPKIVRKALNHRANTTHMSFKKYPVILAAARKDDVVCGTLMYHASHTGRFGGRLLQPQNLTRGNIDGVEAVERIHQGEFSVDLVKSCVRPMIYHPDSFTIVDYSSIEARVLQWVAGDEDALQVFRDGIDSYKWMAAKIYGVEYEDVTPAERFCGKQSILGLGYQMSAKTFIDMIESYGETMSRADAELAVKVYRDTHKKAVRLWATMQAGAAMALERPGNVIRVNARIQYVKEGNFLKMLLPSGRCINYYKPRLEESFGKATVSYMGVNDKNQYVRVKTYGGKLTENAVQAISRDILCVAVRTLHEDGYRIITHIHDEVVLLGTHDLSMISDKMCSMPEWANGIPLEAEGFHSPRYKKG